MIFEYAKTYRPTPRQKELMQLLYDGHSPDSAAEEMGVSIKTVNFHLMAIYKEMGMNGQYGRNRPRAIRYFRHLGLIHDRTPIEKILCDVIK